MRNISNRCYTQTNDAMCDFRVCYVTCMCCTAQSKTREKIDKNKCTFVLHRLHSFSIHHSAKTVLPTNHFRLRPNQSKRSRFFFRVPVPHSHGGCIRISIWANTFVIMLRVHILSYHLANGISTVIKTIMLLKCLSFGRESDIFSLAEKKPKAQPSK